jgi:hypothetical protein
MRWAEVAGMFGGGIDLVFLSLLCVMLCTSTTD